MLNTHSTVLWTKLWFVWPDQCFSPMQRYISKCTKKTSQIHCRRKEIVSGGGGGMTKKIFSRGIIFFGYKSNFQKSGTNMPPGSYGTEIVWKQHHHGMIAMSTIKKPWTLLLCTFCSTIEWDVKQHKLNINSGIQFCHSIHLIHHFSVCLTHLH